MKNTRSILLLVVVVNLPGVLEPARSQPRQNKFGIGILAGGAKLSGDIEQTNTGFTAGALVRFSPFPFFAFSASTTYGTLTSGLNALKTDILSAAISGSLFLFPSSGYRPFVSAGLSNFHYLVKDGSGNQLTNSTGNPIKGWRRGLQLGGGFELFTGRNWALNSAVNYVFAPVDDLDGITQGKNDGYFRATIGLVRYFNKSKKSRNGVRRAANWQRKEGVSFAEVRGTSVTSQGNQSRGTDGEASELFSQEIFFKSGTAEIDGSSLEHLEKISRYLLANPLEELELLPASAIEIENPRLRELIFQRAQSVKRYLVNLGTPPDNVLIGPKSKN